MPALLRAAALLLTCGPAGFGLEARAFAGRGGAAAAPPARRLRRPGAAAKPSAEGAAPTPAPAGASASADSWLQQELAGSQDFHATQPEGDQGLEFKVLASSDSIVSSSSSTTAGASLKDQVAMINSMLLNLEEGHDIEALRCWDRAQHLQREVARTQSLLDEEERMMADIVSQLEVDAFMQESAAREEEGLRRSLLDHTRACGAKLAAARRDVKGLRNDSAAVALQAGSLALLGGSARQRLALLVRCEGRRLGPIMLGARPPSPGGMRALLQSPGVQREIQHSLSQVGLSHASKCILERSVNYEDAESAMIVSHASLEDELWQARQEQVQLKSECQRASAGYKDQMKSLTLRHAQLQARVALATSQRSALQDSVALKKQEVAQLRKEAVQVELECASTQSGYHEDACNLRRVRAELLQVTGIEVSEEELQDCEVLGWVPEPCSAPCGGGVQRLSRTVSVENGTYGAACPPLLTQEACNTQPCPTHCEVSDWDEWSSCTALCGGGSRSRSRAVLVEAKDGGEPCPQQTTETGACAQEACEVDCVLGDWGPWGQCSRACGGGLRQRTQQVVRPAVGGGYCPSEQHLRDYGRCNDQSCPESDDVSFRCSARVDVVLVLDGGEEADGQEGFEESKTFAADLLQKLQLSALVARAAVVVAGAPVTWRAYQDCLNGAATSLQDCGVSVAVPFPPKGSTVDPEGATIEAIGALQWPKGPGNIGGALSLAATELFREGRYDAQWVVLVVSRSRPLSMSKTGEEAEMLRRHARFIWVAATAGGALRREAAQWVTEPCRDNFLDSDLEGLVPEAATLVCPAIGHASVNATAPTGLGPAQAPAPVPLREPWRPDQAAQQVRAAVPAFPRPRPLRRPGSRAPAPLPAPLPALAAAVAA
ncbi:unnamed protein product, partial [Prorocentrum cordatum]